MKKLFAFDLCSKRAAGLALLLTLAALPLAASEITLIPLGTTNRIVSPQGSTNWHYRIGSSEASSPLAAWRTNTFVEDGTWSVGSLPLGYATDFTDPFNYQANLVTTVPTATTCVYTRRTFVISNRLSYSSLTVSGFTDDGVVVWINGRELTPRFQCCTGGADANVPTFDSLASAALETAAFNFTVPNDITGPLVEGTNVLCIQLFNANSTSSDLVLDASLSVTLDDSPPQVFGQAPPAGTTVLTLGSVQVNFSEDVTGVDGADLLINGVAATNMLPISPSIYTFEFATPPTGAVSVAFAPTHGITDNASNAFNHTLPSSSWSYTFDPNAPIALFYISEFLASNNGNGTNALRDEDGDASDWIEIANPGSTPQSIGGWFLTDTTNSLTKWRFPDGASVPALGYLVVFASGKNRTNNLARLHSNFQLSADPPEYLALVNPNTNIISHFFPTYPTQQQNVSYGLDKANPNIKGFFLVPTPGAHNLPGIEPGLEVQFSRSGGTFSGSFQLALSTSDTNNRIYYNIVTAAENVSTATNIPGVNATLYTGPITVNNTVQVRARAFPATPVSFPGPPHTECFIQVNTGITNFVSSLPIVVLHTLAPATLSGGFPALDNSVIISCFDNTGGTASLMATPQMIKRAGINLRGSSTQTFPKSSFAVEFWDEFNEDEEASFAGLPKESDWVLYAPNQFDNVLMHNPIMHQIGRDMGYYSSRTRFVEVFFRNGSGAITGTTNSTGTGMGDYYGVFVLEEKVKRDGNRLDIDQLTPEQTNYPAITGGYLLKIDRTDANERNFVGGGGLTIIYQDPDGLEMVTPPRAAQATYIKGFVDSYWNGIANNTVITNVASTNHYSNYLDINGTIDLHIANVLTLNVDGYRLSGYINKPRNGKMIWGPLWDVDRGLGTSRADGRGFNPRCWQASNPSATAGTDNGTDFFQGNGTALAVSPLWLGRMFSDLDFWQVWIDRYQEWRLTKLDTNYLSSVVDGFGAELREAQVREVKRWGGSGASDTSPRSGPLTSFNGDYTYTFPSPGTYQGEIDFQKRWIAERIHFMDTNLLGRPSFSVSEGMVALGTLLTINDNSGKAGTRIYYTLDGTDPRGFQGITNPAAILYTGPITITNNVRVHIRAVNPTHSNMTGTSGVTTQSPAGSRNPPVSSRWSGNRAATFFVTTPPLVISELMYHPAPSPSIFDTNDPDNFEYVELQNIGTNALNLIGFRFTNGINFTFTATNGVTNLGPGQFVLIVKNVNSFTARYGLHTNVAGAYGGTLDNAGERLVLVGPRLEPILDFTYSDEWYPLSDGLGFSLVILDPNAPLDSWADKDSWRTSAGENGSAGFVDPPPPDLPVIFVNEALTHTDIPELDTIELFNPGTNDANIGGWYLSDDGTDPKKYQIPPDTMIPAGGFLLFNEDDFNAGGPNSFSLSSSGDELFLFSATNGLLSGYAHGFDFSGAQNGVAFGRYVNSQGNEDFVAQSTTNTFLAANALPLVGDIVISEIMYHPPDTALGTNIVDNSLDEFVELHNITTNAVPLYGPTTNTANTWKLDKAISFTFPTNISIAPTSFVLVVNFNPTNTAQLAAFRNRYGVSNSIPVFGPYGGKLDNSGGNIHLIRPDNPNLDSTVPYILVDRVQYNDGGAWPETADGAGASLQRLVLTDYGNDPTNWIAASASAGIDFPHGTPPLITQQPADATVFVAGTTAGSTVYSVGTTNFTASVDGADVKIQWRFNGVAIPGATNAVLTLTNIQTVNAGLYGYLAFNGGGSVFSSNALLSVITPVTITIQPTNQNVLPGTNVTLVASATGTGTIRYQWRFEGTNILNATNNSYSFTGANLFDHHGNFSVVIEDDISQIVSADAFIYVLVRPFVTQHITSQSVLQGQNITFSLMATGAPPLWYRWIRGGGSLLGATTSVPVLVITNVQASTTLRVAVTNVALPSSGTGAFSPGPAAGNNIQITMLADADGDGMWDLWETNHFGPSFGTNFSLVAPGADPDGDGMSNLDEYRSGTNPTNALSVLKIVLTATNANVLEFVAQTNLTYSVQSRTNLSDAIWNTLTNISLSNAVRTIRVDSATAPGGNERFIRVITPREP